MSPTKKKQPEESDMAKDPPKRKKASPPEPTGASKPSQKRSKKTTADTPQTQEIPQDLKVKPDTTKVMGENAEVPEGENDKRPRNPRGLASTFARRYKPTSVFGAAKWEAIRSAFDSVIRAHVTRPYTHEDRGYCTS